MKIKINKGNFGVPMVIRQSFSFNTRSYGSHKAEVVLAKDGEYSMTIDGSYAYSIHDAAAKRSPLLKMPLLRFLTRCCEPWKDAMMYIHVCQGKLHV